MKRTSTSELSREFRKAFPPRKQTAHKGEFGRIFILAGSRGLTGAGLLASMGALRAGAGLVSLGTPRSCAAMILRRVPEVMVKPLAETKQGSLDPKAIGDIRKFLRNQDVFALGPGLSQEKNTQALIRRLVRECWIPIVIDADGLNAFSGHLNELKNLRAPVILTPHPGEFRCLFGVRLSGKDPDRVRWTKKVSAEYKLTVVLKGAGTVIASPDGRASINPTGGPALAKGGSGDVLCGIVSAFLGQGLEPFRAARLAVFVHGYAADLAAKDLGEASLTATELCDYLPKAFRKILGR